MIIRTLPHIMARAFGQPLMIERGKLDALILGLQAALQHRGSLLPSPEPFVLTAEDMPQPAGPEERPHGYSVQRGVALLPVHGVLVKRAGEYRADSTEFQSYERLTGTLHRAVANPRIKAVLLDIDSPGGEANGIFEFSREVREAARKKPVWSVANDTALSAAYAIAAAADKVWLTETGAVGSIGVVAAHLDQSKFDDETGLRWTYIFHGEHKVDGNPHQPLSTVAHLGIQTEVDRLGGMLIDHLADYRKAPPARLRDTQARIIHEPEARDLGLVDRIGSLAEAHAALADSVSPGSNGRGPSKMEDDNVVGIETARSEGAAEATARILAIVNACELARRPALAAQFVESGKTLVQVQQELLALHAAEDQARRIEVINPMGPTGAPPLRGGATAAEVAQANAERFKAYQTRTA